MYFTYWLGNGMWDAFCRGRRKTPSEETGSAGQKNRGGDDAMGATIDVLAKLEATKLNPHAGSENTLS